MLQVAIFNADMIEAHKILMERYIEVIKNSTMTDGEKAHWINFCITALSVKNSDKLSRWVGFIQGLLYGRGFITVEEERDFSREIYKPIYDKYGLDSSTITV